MSRRMMTSVALAAAVLMLATACGGGKRTDKSDASDTSTSASPSSTAASSTPSASPTPAWMAKYTPAQIHTYNGALTTWNEFGAKSQPLFDAGRLSPTVRALLMKYTTPKLSAELLQGLRVSQQHAAKMTGNQRVLWSKPAQIAPNQVTLLQCIDLKSVRVTWDGKTSKFPFKGPVIQRPTMLLQGGRWIVAVLGDPTVDPSKAKPCH